MYVCLLAIVTICQTLQDNRNHH